MKLAGVSLSIQSYWLKMPADGKTCERCSLPIIGEGYGLFVQATPPDVSELSIHDAGTVLCRPCYSLVYPGKTV